MRISGSTSVCASLALPNKTSSAPVMYNAGFSELGLDYCYVAFEPESIREAIGAVRSLKLRGVSISKPYKEEVIPYLDSIDETSQAIGAVNVVDNPDGSLRGYNSDWIGAINSLEEVTKVSGKKVALLGAGGASRAVLYGLRTNGAEVHLFNRSDQRGRALADEFDVSWGGGVENVKRFDADILVNATSVGLAGGTVSSFDADVVCDSHVVMDINVRSDLSPLMKIAEERGATVIGGVRMLVLQGAFTFEKFTGRKAPVEVMQSAVEKYLCGQK